MQIEKKLGNESRPAEDFLRQSLRYASRLRSSRWTGYNRFGGLTSAANTPEGRRILREITR